LSVFNKKASRTIHFLFYAFLLVAVLCVAHFYLLGIHDFNVFKLSEHLEEMKEAKRIEKLRADGAKELEELKKLAVDARISPNPDAATLEKDTAWLQDHTNYRVALPAYVDGRKTRSLAVDRTGANLMLLSGDDSDSWKHLRCDANGQIIHEITSGNLAPALDSLSEQLAEDLNNGRLVLTEEEMGSFEKVLMGGILAGLVEEKGLQTFDIRDDRYFGLMVAGEDESNNPIWLLVEFKIGSPIEFVRYHKVDIKHLIIEWGMSSFPCDSQFRVFRDYCYVSFVAQASYETDVFAYRFEIVQVNRKTGEQKRWVSDFPPFFTDEGIFYCGSEFIRYIAFGGDERVTPLRAPDYENSYGLFNKYSNRLKWEMKFFVSNGEAMVLNVIKPYYGTVCLNIAHITEGKIWYDGFPLWQKNSGYDIQYYVNNLLFNIDPDFSERHIRFSPRNGERGTYVFSWSDTDGYRIQRVENINSDEQYVRHLDQWYPARIARGDELTTRTRPPESAEDENSGQEQKLFGNAWQWAASGNTLPINISDNQHLEMVYLKTPYTLSFERDDSWELEPFPSSKQKLAEYWSVNNRQFFIGKTEVTQSQYMQVLGKNPSHFIGTDRPVENVSYADAVEFCRSLPSVGNTSFTLPTLYECNDAYVKVFKTVEQNLPGQIIKDANAWTAENAGEKTHPVASKEPAAFGIYGMFGNVSEWVSRDNFSIESNDLEDEMLYEELYGDDPPRNDPYSLNTQNYHHLAIGGSWQDSRPEALYSVFPEYPYCTIPGSQTGFRVFGRIKDVPIILMDIGETRKSIRLQWQDAKDEALSLK